MADITRYPFLRHLRGAPTVHVTHLRGGAPAHAGTGLSFWFTPGSAVLSEVPVDDRELPLVFHARTADFQDVTVQLSLTYRVVDPDLAARRVDFSVDPDTGAWRGTPLAQVAGLLTESAQQRALDLLARAPLAEALVTGVAAVRAEAAAGLAADPRLAQTGIAVVDVRVVALRPTPEVEKALQTPARERVQQDADRATYERRAVAVERERAIGENELQNQIELARREEQLVTQRGTNARRQAEEAAAAAAIEADARAARTRIATDVDAEHVRTLGAAQADAERGHLEAHRDVPEAVLLALALQELAKGLPKVESLVLTPDLLAPVLARLGRAGEAS